MVSYYRIADYPRRSRVCCLIFGRNYRDRMRRRNLPLRWLGIPGQVPEQTSLASRFGMRACELDLEGIVAKHRLAPYRSTADAATWLKIRNPHYSQWAGRHELFERERHREPVPGWHCCELAACLASSSEPARLSPRVTRNSVFA
jgi:hypothetical protein